MGWFGDMQWQLDEAKKEIEGNPKNSLAWLRGVETWNDTLYEIGAKLWKSDYQPSVQLPHNCDIPEWDLEEMQADRLPTIDYPNFDGTQVLQEAEFVTEEEAVKA